MIGLGLAVLWGGPAAPEAPEAASPTPPVVRAAAPEAPSPTQPAVRAVAAEAERPDADANAVRAHLERYARHTDLTPDELDRLARVVADESRRHGVATDLVLAVMHVESRFRTFAVSEKNAMGLMQILPSTGRWLAPQLGLEWQGPHTLFDPVVNARLGIAYLRQLQERYPGNLAAALAAYNWGPGHIDRRIARGVPLPEEYPRLVLDARERTTHRS